MSYCRFSSDNWKCQLYCYEDVSGGFTTHVASRKHQGEAPVLDMDGLAHDRITPAEFQTQYDAQSKWLETTELLAIGLKYDGMQFNDPDLESFLARLLHLRDVGYIFPDYVIASVREEIEDAKNHPTTEK